MSRLSPTFGTSGTDVFSANGFFTRTVGCITSWVVLLHPRVKTPWVVPWVAVRNRISAKKNTHYLKNSDQMATAKTVYTSLSVSRI